MIAVGFFVGACACALGTAVAANSGRTTLAIGAAQPRCPPFPWLPRAIAVSAVSGLQNGVTAPDALTTWVMRWVYNRTPTGLPLTWPAGANAPPAVRCIEDRVRIRVHRILAVTTDEAANAIGGT